jgi:hypothetical protein
MVDVMDMTDYRCPKHPETKLLYVLKGGAGYCLTCSQYTQAAGVPMPKLPKVASRTKTRKTVRGTGRGKVRVSAHR